MTSAGRGAVQAAAWLAASAFAIVAAALAPAAPAADTGAPAYAAGAATYQASCAVCHGAAGAGLPSLAPPLLSYPARYAASAEGRRQLALTVLYGMYGDIAVEGKHYAFRMPEFGQLDDASLATVLNFVLFDLGHASSDLKPLAAAEIAAERAHPLDGAAVREHRKSVAPTEP